MCCDRQRRPLGCQPLRRAPHLGPVRQFLAVEPVRPRGVRNNTPEPLAHTTSTGKAGLSSETPAPAAELLAARATRFKGERRRRHEVEEEQNRAGFARFKLGLPDRALDESTDMDHGDDGHGET